MLKLGKFLLIIIFSASTLSFAQASAPTEAEILRTVQAEIQKHSIGTFEDVQMRIFNFKANPDKELTVFANEIANILKRDRYLESYLTEASALAFANRLIALVREPNSHYAIYNEFLFSLYQTRSRYFQRREDNTPKISLDLNQIEKIESNLVTIYQVPPQKFEEIRSLLPFFNSIWPRSFSISGPARVEVALIPIKDIPGARVFIANDPVHFHSLMKRLAHWDQFPGEFFKGERLFGLYFFGIANPNSFYSDFLSSAINMKGYEPLDPNDFEEIRRLSIEKEFLTLLNPMLTANPNDILMGGSADYAFRATLSHESIHAQYRLTPAIPELVLKFWNENMPEEDRKAFINALSSTYNPDMAESIRNEFMAYMLTENAENVYSKPAMIELILKYRDPLLKFFKDAGIEILR